MLLTYYWQTIQFSYRNRVINGLSRTLHSTQYTHHNLKYMLPQHCITYNDVSLLIVSTKV